MTSDNNPLTTVDISYLDDPKIAKELLDALVSQGFVFIDGHNFQASEVDKIFDISKQFFKLPLDYKRKFPFDSSNSGYIEFNRENLDPNAKKDFKEGLNFSGIDFTTGGPSGAIPDWFVEEQERYTFVKDMTLKLNKLALDLLLLLAKGLEIEGNDKEGGVPGAEWFTSRYKPTSKSGSTLRFLHYPAQTTNNNGDGEVRAGAHTDYGSMTLLFQKKNQEGLEIYSPVSRKWEKVPFVDSTKPGMAPPIIVNIGDLLSYWTAGLLKSTIHRVKFSNLQTEDRYSVVFFSHPSDETLLEPVPSKLLRDRTGRGVAKDTEYITALQHLEKKLANTYGY
ncbi:hypothetical protein KGF57_002097 [Candida theae]|uniref:Fe2OG dioxygenase domain-containing protein n=1 Tax=Candida theae TaxID=1198502 RepID=A0AAD5FZ69_9ASCO|nr:uncharacterized protein KGF57_002097 [Candida theae]KAI5959459.1 hypothetical protein KGF57_002097 [Candida theae]